MIRTLLMKVHKLLKDPFGRKELYETHAPILTQLVQTTARTEQVTTRMKTGRYPIGSVARRNRHITSEGA